MVRFIEKPACLTRLLKTPLYSTIVQARLTKQKIVLACALVRTLVKSWMIAIPESLSRSTISIIDG
jgi:hypothetical protein